jgi:hypothetical protein
MLYLITLKIGVIIGGVGSVWCGIMGLLKSQAMEVSQVEASATGSLIGTVLVFVGFCLGSYIAGAIYPLDTQLDGLEHTKKGRLTKVITMQKVIKNPTLKERLREGGRESSAGGAGVLLGGLLAGIVMCGIGAAIDAIFGMEGIADLLI